MKKAPNGSLVANYQANSDFQPVVARGNGNEMLFYRQLMTETIINIAHDSKYVAPVFPGDRRQM